MKIILCTNPTKKSVQLDKKVADVNGDGINDVATLVGETPGGQTGAFVENIKVIIQDGKTKQKSEIPVQFGGGYSPKLFLGDFNGDLIADILVTLETGGSGGYIWSELHSFKNNIAKPLYNPGDFNAGLPFNVVFLDDYKVKVSQSNDNRSFILDVGDRKDVYKDIYRPDGKLIRPVEGGVLALGALNPIDLNRDGTFSLLSLQRIIGMFNMDTLGYVATTWKWDKTHFVPVLVNVII